MSNGQQTTTATTTVEIASPATQLTPHFQDTPLTLQGWTDTSAAELVAQFNAEMPKTFTRTKRVIFKDESNAVVFSSSDLPRNVVFTFDDESGDLVGVQLINE